MTALTQLSQAIHDAPRWHQPEQFQDTNSIHIIPAEDQALGAVVWGLDARKAQSGATIFKLKQALAEHLILIFKQQSLDDLQFLAFATHFGAIFHPSADNPVLATQTDTGTPPDVIPVSNAVGQGDYTGFGELTPHAEQQDAGYGESPYYRFKDQPIIGHAYPHPLVRTHPETGRKALWLNTRSEVELVNYDDQAGSELIAKLRAHILKPEFRYEHAWEKGDIVFWDNQVTLHSRKPFPSDQRCLLKRISLAGGRPY